MSVKQVIVMRKDTDPPMRKGKMAAQAAHASLSFMAKLVKENLDGTNRVKIIFTPVQIEWLTNAAFTKIVLGVETLEELHEIFNKARAAKLEVHMITDSGKTEFDGPTVTCLAIGPDEASKIDPITGHLKPL